MSAAQIEWGDAAGVTAGEAARRLGVQTVLFRFVNESILKHPVRRLGNYLIVRLADVPKVDAYLRSVDPAGAFRRPAPSAAADADAGNAAT